MGTSCTRIVESRRGQGYMMSSSQGLAMVAIAALAFLAPSVSAQDNKNCTFGPGICPVTKENVVDVFYFDVVDDFSCQQHCLDLDECHFFTMYGVKDTPKDHMKCFMFKTCDHLEPCPECTTGPDPPPMPHPLPPCNPPNYICPTTRQNVLDVDYFDAEDNFSCKLQCQLENDCNFWTVFKVPDQKHKCFMFKDCKTHEPCDPYDCENGQK